MPPILILCSVILFVLLVFKSVIYQNKNQKIENCIIKKFRQPFVQNWVCERQKSQSKNGVKESKQKSQSKNKRVKQKRKSRRKSQSKNGENFLHRWHRQSAQVEMKEATEKGVAKRNAQPTPAQSLLRIHLYWRTRHHYSLPVIIVAQEEIQIHVFKMLLRFVKFVSHVGP